MNSRLLIASIALICLPACGGGEDADTSVATDISSSPATNRSAQSSAMTSIIDDAALRARIEVLASDEFEGRAPGTRGGEKARAYLIDEMKKIGLEPGAGDTYEQEVPLVEISPQTDQSYLSINGERLKPGAEIVYWTKRTSEEISVQDSDLVFVGYGIVAPEYGWNDYDGIDVDGKTVLILVNDPGFATKDPDLFNGVAMTYYGRWTYKFEEAARQGAAAAIIIHQSAPAGYGWNVVEGSWTGAQLDLERPDDNAGRVALESWIQESVARVLFGKAGYDFDDMIKAAHSREFQATPLTGLTAAGVVKNKVKKFRSANIAGALRGSTRPDEYVLYMGHWDHLGRLKTDEEGDEIANGAVDNASGVAGILSIAEAFVESNARPERSILFLAVTAEESGLLGSSYFAENPLVPLKKLAGGVNIDGMPPTPMTKDIVVIGYGASDLEDLLKQAALKNGQYLRPDPEPEKGYFYRSDHISLAKTGVPMLFARTGVDLVDGGEDAGRALNNDYIENRYHKPGDEYSDDWDTDGIRQSLHVFYQTGDQLANMDYWPNWYDGNEFRAIRDDQRALNDRKE